MAIFTIYSRIDGFIPSKVQPPVEKLRFVLLSFGTLPQPATLFFKQCCQSFDAILVK